MKEENKEKELNKELVGWNNIAAYLGQPVAVVQRWAKSGLPITRQGRRVRASRQELDSWLGHQSGASQPLHIATDHSDLLQYLRGSLTQARAHPSKAPAQSARRKSMRKKAA